MKTIYITKNKKIIMSLPSQFEKENYENILIYHYVEELVSDFSRYTTENYNDGEVTVAELPFLLRIRFADEGTQKDLVNLFHISNGYASKILRRFEDNGFISRAEDPKNRRRKIVKMTEKGIAKTDSILEHVAQWENGNMNEEEMKTLKKLLFKFLNNY